VAVTDLLSRQVVGWAMQGQMRTELVLQALTMAVWRRRPPRGRVLHSDQGSQFTSGDWQAFLRDHGIECSMSRRGNCHDNAVAESFFQLLKRERMRQKIYLTRDEARADVFDYIEMFLQREKAAWRQRGPGSGRVRARIQTVWGAKCLEKPGRFRQRWVATRDGARHESSPKQL
jgi:transposase InsO family protein